MRKAPPCRQFLRMDSANSRYPSSRWRAELGGGNAQSWPLGEKSSGGEPTRHPARCKFVLHWQVRKNHPPPPTLRGEGARLRRAGVLVSRRPVGPQPEAGIPPVQFFVQRAVGGERRSEEHTSELQ